MWNLTYLASDHNSQVFHVLEPGRIKYSIKMGVLNSYGSYFKEGSWCVGALMSKLDL